MLIVLILTLYKCVATMEMFASGQSVHMLAKKNAALGFMDIIHIGSSLVPRLLHRKTGREPGRFHHVPRDVACVVLCVVLIIELLPTQ